MSTLIDTNLFRDTIGRFASGVTVVTAEAEGELRGMTANAFVSVSLEPPLVLVSVDKKAHMHALLKPGQRYGVSILAEDQAAYSTHFAGWKQPGLQPVFVRKEGVPLLEGAVAHIVAEVVDPHEAGDHTLYIGEVKHLSFDEARAPLLYYRGKYGTYEAT